MLRGAMSQHIRPSAAPPGPSVSDAERQLVRQSSSWALTPGEVLVFESDARWHPGRRLLHGLIPNPTRRSAAPYAVLFGLAGLSALLMVAGPAWLKDVAPALFMLFTFGLMASILGGGLWGPLRSLLRPLLASGQVRITSERLLWRPVFGRPQAVRLDAIADGGITVEPFKLDLRVMGDRRLNARAVLEATEVAALLELHRQPPLRGAARTGVRLEQAAILPAKLDEEQRGHCVLRPGGVSFIPAKQGPEALRAITGKDVSLEEFDADGLLDALRWLPEEEFDAWVARVVKATGGTSGTPRSVSIDPEASASGWKHIRIKCGGSVLEGRLVLAQEAAVKAILRDGGTPAA